VPKGGIISPLEKGGPRGIFMLRGMTSHHEESL